MEQVTQNTNLSIPRDYDKDPIVIKDKIPEIASLLFLGDIFIVFSIFFIYMHFAGKTIDWTQVMIMFSIMIIPSFLFQRKILHSNPKITLYDKSMVRSWENESLAIYWENVETVKNGFIDFYDNKQEALPPVKLLFPIYAPFMLLTYHPFVILIKQLIKLLKGYRFDLLDTLYIFDKDGLKYAIFIDSEELYEELHSYFIYHNINIKNLRLFYSVSYVFIGNNQLFTSKKDK